MSVCPKCQCTNLVYDPTQGHTSCYECGCVVEESQIVMELSFQDNGGGSSMVGQIVGASGHTYVSGPGGMHMNADSREQTIRNARQQLQQLGSLLRLSDHHIEAATRLYTLALQKNFSRGRRLPVVLAACLYVICRQECTPHMLIDFSDAMKTNVFVLGHTYLQLIKKLSLASTLPVLDPSLYIHRFASELGFGDKAHAVATSALRLVGRMKRDWMQFGRRPAGICGAGLLIAARLHGFPCSVKDVVSVVRICESTIYKRLDEFTQTPASNLSFNEFVALGDNDASLGQCDPPVFANAKKKLKRAKKTQQGKPALEALEFVEEQAELPSGAQLEEEMQRTLANTDLKAFVDPHTTLPRAAQREDVFAPSQGEGQGEGEGEAQAVAAELPQSAQEGQGEERGAKRPREEGDEEEGEEGEGKKGGEEGGDDVLALLSKRLEEAERAREQTQQEAESRNNGDEGGEVDKGNGEGGAAAPEAGVDTFSDISDAEVEALLVRNDEEVRLKNTLWLDLHADWVEAQRLKAIEDANKKPTQPRKKRKKAGALPAAQSAVEAVQNALSHRAPSSKINYAAVKDLFSFDPSEIGKRARLPLGPALPAHAQQGRPSNNNNNEDDEDDTPANEALFAGIDDDDDDDDAVESEDEGLRAANAYRGGPDHDD